MLRGRRESCCSISKVRSRMSHGTAHEYTRHSRSYGERRISGPASIGSASVLRLQMRHHFERRPCIGIVACIGRSLTACSVFSILPIPRQSRARFVWFQVFIVGWMPGWMTSGSKIRARSISRMRRSRSRDEQETSSSAVMICRTGRAPIAQEVLVWFNIFQCFRPGSKSRASGARVRMRCGQSAGHYWRRSGFGICFEEIVRGRAKDWHYLRSHKVERESANLCAGPAHFALLEGACTLCRIAPSCASGKRFRRLLASLR